MHYLFPSHTETKDIDGTLVIDAARAWRCAHDEQRPVQPSLFASLAARGYGVLAPVFDSLIHLCETALGRPFRIGAGAEMSADEHLLLDLLADEAPVPSRLRCGEGVAAVLDTALRSTRIMLQLAGIPAARPAPIAQG